MILDVGCGGRPQGDVNVELEFNTSAQRGDYPIKDKKTISNPVRADAHNLPFRSDAFEIVYSSHLLEHIFEPIRVLLEFKRVSKRYVVLEVPTGQVDDCPFHLYSWNEKTIKRFLNKIFPTVVTQNTVRPIDLLRRRRIPIATIGEIFLKGYRMTRQRKQATAICDKTPVKYVYSVSSKGNMIRQVCKSIDSLRQFTDIDHIIVFCTPPLLEKDLLLLKSRATVEIRPNITKPFEVIKGRGFRNYGEKVWLCSVDCPNVIFLDADTIVRKNPADLLDGDYDISVRIGARWNRFDKQAWNTMFEIGKPIIPVPNAGFVIFKNYAHKRIHSRWLNLINSDLPTVGEIYTKEQNALAVVISDMGLKVRWMYKEQHAFAFAGEFGFGSYVVHGKKPLRRILVPYRIRRFLIRHLRR